MTKTLAPQTLVLRRSATCSKAGLRQKCARKSRNGHESQNILTSSRVHQKRMGDKRIFLDARKNRYALHQKCTKLFFF